MKTARPFLTAKPKISHTLLRVVALLFCIYLQDLFAQSVLTYGAGGFVLPQNATVTFGNMTLAMQGDGNLVLYQSGTAVWSSSTYGQNCGSNQCFAVFQSDGNFVVYNGSTPLWNTSTGVNWGAELVLSTQLPYIQVLGSNQSVAWASSWVSNAWMNSDGRLELFYSLPARPTTRGSRARPSSKTGP